MKVLIPTPLYSYTNHQSTVEAAGGTIDQVTRDLDRQFAGLRFRIINEQDHVRPHVKIFLNGQQVFALDTKVTPTDTVAIVQAFSGG